MYRGRSNILPIIIMVIIAVVAIIALVTLGRNLLRGDSDGEVVNDAATRALLNTEADRSVSMAVRGQIVAEVTTAVPSSVNVSGHGFSLISTIAGWSKYSAPCSACCICFGRRLTSELNSRRFKIAATPARSVSLTSATFQSSSTGASVQIRPTSLAKNLPPHYFESLIRLRIFSSI